MHPKKLSENGCNGHFIRAENVRFWHKANIIHIAEDAVSG